MYIEFFGCYDPECAARPLSRRRAAAEQQALGGCVMRRSATVAVCLAVFVDMLGFGIILPSLPLRAAGLGGGGVWVGALLTAYAAAQFLAAPVLGSLSDKYGRRRLLLLSLAGSAVSLAVTGVADSLLLLLAARVVAGGSGSAPVRSAWSGRASGSASSSDRRSGPACPARASASPASASPPPRSPPRT